MINRSRLFRHRYWYDESYIRVRGDARARARLSLSHSHLGGHQEWPRHPHTLARALITSSRGNSALHAARPGCSCTHGLVFSILFLYPRIAHPDRTRILTIARRTPRTLATLVRICVWHYVRVGSKLTRTDGLVVE